MRRSRFRPTFDRLDARLVLDSSAAVVITGVPVATAVPTVTDTDTDTDTDDDGDVVPTSGWYQGGTDPTPDYDTDDPPVPIVIQTTGSSDSD